MNIVTRKITQWFSRRADLPASSDLRPYGLHRREWTGKLDSRRNLAPGGESVSAERLGRFRRSVQNIRGDLQEH